MDLKNIVPWGRSIEEYQKIFSLTGSDLNEHIASARGKDLSINHAEW